MLGPEHPNTLKTKQHLAELLYATDRGDEALALYREVVEVRQRVLGANNATTLKSKGSLRDLLKEQGQHRKIRMHA